MLVTDLTPTLERSMKLIATQSANVSVKFRNANGFPVSVDDGIVTWSSDNTSIATVAVDADDNSRATITAQGSPGIAHILATADADLGEGVTEVHATIEVEVIARGQAVGGEIDVDTPDQGLPPIPGHDLPGQPGVDNSLPDAGEEPPEPSQGPDAPSPR